MSSVTQCELTESKGCLGHSDHAKAKSAFFPGCVASPKMLVQNIILQDNHFFALAVIFSEFDSV